MKPYTIAQIVESAYFWANGDMKRGTYVAAPEGAPVGGDGLLNFLLSETSVDEGMDCPPNSPDHWSEAIQRMYTVLNEVSTVLEQLERHAPGGTQRLDLPTDDVELILRHLYRAADDHEHASTNSELFTKEQQGTAKLAMHRVRALIERLEAV